MLTRLRRRLLLSASGRNLAIELLTRHGAHALNIVNSRTDACDDAEILEVAREEIIDLLPLLDVPET